MYACTYIYIYIYIYISSARCEFIIYDLCFLLYTDIHMCVCVCVRVCVCVCVCVHAVLSTIFSQLILTLNCYSAMVCFWRHLVSLMQKWKYPQPNPEMTLHIRDRSRKPSTAQVWDGTGTLASPPLMLKHKTMVYLALHTNKVS